MEFFCGLDVAVEKTTVCVIDDRDEAHLTVKVATDWDLGDDTALLSGGHAMGLNAIVEQLKCQSKDDFKGRQFEDRLIALIRAPWPDRRGPEFPEACD